MLKITSILLLFCSTLLSAQTFSITFSHGNNGTLKGETSQSVAYGGQTQPVSAVPDNHYVFYRWEDSAGLFTSTDNPLSVYVFRDMTITAIFKAQDYVIKFYAGSGGSISGTTSQKVTYGSSTLPVTAMPEPGRRFTGWTDNDTGETVSMDEEITLTNVSASRSLTANFSSSDTYVVHFLPNSHGSISGEINQYVVKGGSCTAVTAVPNAGYAFSTWSGSVIGKANPLTLTNVTSDMMVYANFSLDETKSVLTMTIAPEGAGTSDPEEGQHTYDIGATLAVTATPANDTYTFNGWTAIPESSMTISDPISLSTTISINSSGKLVANFIQTSEFFSPVFFTCNIRGASKDSLKTKVYMPEFNPNEQDLTVNIGESSTTFKAGGWNEKGVYGKANNYSAVYKEKYLNLRLTRTTIGNLETEPGVDFSAVIGTTPIAVSVPVSKNISWKMASSLGLVEKFQAKYSTKNDQYSISLTFTSSEPLTQPYIKIGEAQWLEGDDGVTFQQKGSTYTVKISLKNDPQNRGILIPETNPVDILIGSMEGGVYGQDTLECNIQQTLNQVSP